MASTTRGERTSSSGERGRHDRRAAPQEDWNSWVRHLATRRKPPSLCRLLGELIGERVRRPLAWGLASVTGQPTLELIDRLDRFARGKPRAGYRAEADLESWLLAAGSGQGSQQLGWEALAWAHALPALAHELPAESWNTLLNALLELAGEARQAPLPKPDSNLLAHQLLAGELPLTLASVLPELRTCRDLASSARKLLTLGVCEALDGEGLPHAANLEQLRPLAACWTRCRVLDPKCFNREARVQLEWLTRQAIRLSRSDGSQVLSAESESDWCRPLVLAMLSQSGDSADRMAAQRLLPLKGAKRGKAKLFEPTVFSAWSELAVLRADWSPRSPQLTVVFDKPQMRCELSADQQLWLSGPWQTEFLVDGQPVEQQSAWEEVCWFSDEDVDYLELERQLSGKWRVQRQMLLAREDGFVLLCDALLGEHPAELACRSRIPLASEPRVRASKQTRELLLTSEECRTRCLPLALPEWRAESARGDLSGEGRQLCWETSGRGQNLFHPLFLDLDRRRADKEITWRRLTVGEQRQIMPPDVAVGYRVQIGKKQWLLYRSLAPAANRTLLGQNYSNEFVLGRFTKDGTTDPLLEIESA